MMIRLKATLPLATASLIALILVPEGARAFVELNGFYTSEASKSATTGTSSRLFIEGAAGFAVDRKGAYQVGWAYSMFTTTDKTTVTETYASTQMGPRFIWNIDRNKNWSVGLGYYLVTSAKYDDGPSPSETWKGTALKADFGYNTPVADQLYIGIRFNYSSATYKEKLVGSATYSAVNYSKTLMYPSIYTIWLF